MYNSIYQHKYQQQFPRFVCRNSSRLHEISQFKGFTCKCRNPRCSLACHQNWARKQGAIIARHLHDLPDQFTPYRGNLSLPKNASPQDHHRVRAAFLLNMSGGRRGTATRRKFTRRLTSLTSTTPTMTSWHSRTHLTSRSVVRSMICGLKLAACPLLVSGSVTTKLTRLHATIRKHHSGWRLMFIRQRNRQNYPLQTYSNRGNYRAWI